MPQAVEQDVTQKWRKEWAQWEAGGGIGGGSQPEPCLISSSPRGSSSATEGRRWPPCPFLGCLKLTSSAASKQRFCGVTE